ncbi:protein eiger [Anopheles aquasalis]|uniref:protein eiger n=1 Tax=Anopheles aquasalis TaxID=42839 RepID=UPI00215B2FD9|nr:protein eiger [Anopheles aquasalis]
MTAESLKPFLNLPNATANELKAKCARKSTAKCALAVLGYTLVVAFCCTVIGVEVWHLSVTDALQREVDDLKLQLKELSMPRAGDFNDYEFDNELFDHGDEYSTAYESEDFDTQPRDDGGDAGDDDADSEDDGDDEDSSLVGTGVLGRSEYAELDGENEEEAEGELLEAWRKPMATGDTNGAATNEDDLRFADDASAGEDISVSGGTVRRARSISGVTHQGVPIVDEPYVPRRNRSRRPHRIYEQLRQRPEELVTPPSTSDMFRWDVESSSSSSSRQSAVAVPHHAPTQQYGSISIRPFHHQDQAHGRREGHHHQGTTPPMSAAYESSARHGYARNQLNAAPTTSAPAAILNRHSRVQATSVDQGSGSQRAALLQQTRFPKVVGNPGTQKEIVMTPETRVRMRTRKAGTAQNGGEPVAKGVHLVKQFVHGVRHRNTRHTHWQASGEANKHSVLSRIFTFDGEQLTVNEPGLYYVYAQITYDNQHDVNGFKVLIGGQKHLSCTVHARGENTNTCFTAGLAEISTAGTPIAIEDVDHGRQHVMYPEKTFFGAFKVGRLPPAQVAKRNV